MNNQEIHERLLSLASRRFGKDLSGTGPEADLFEALEIDSYQAMELLTELEDTFEIEIPDYEVQDVRTFGGLAQVIEQRL